MITQVKFSIPFQQAPIVDYIATNIPNLFENKLVKVSNISPIQVGICRGLSTCFLMHENNNRGTQYIEKINESLDTLIHYEEPQDTLDEYLLNLTKQIRFAEFNVLIHQAINEQIDHGNATELNNLLLDINDFTLREINTEEKNIAYLINLLQAPEIAQRLNEPNTFLSDYDFPANIDFYINKVLNKNNTENLYLSKENMAKVQKQLANNKPLTINDAKLILASFIRYEVEKITLTSAARKVRFGLINDNSYTLEDRHNTNQDGELKTLSQIELDINNSIEKNDYYYCLLASLNHCMAISAHRCDQKVTYKFFDPNEGILISKDSYIFFNQLSQIFNEFNINRETERSYAGQILLNVRSMQKKTDSHNRIKLFSLTNNEIQDNIKKSLIKNKIEIALSENFKMKLKKHDSINSETQLSIVGLKRKWNIYSTETDVEKMILTVAEKLPLIKNKKGNLSIDKYGEIHNR
ncbi:hypothetical protein [Providencia alcalifaciens]|uniref:hypothetical protein n=1 Tax=Providencia alcalifaciens TaxID=126385 RepID=UPI001CC51067|nr:hypothetical protein [Providencia alcalifaciens]CAG9414314.1 hypothetical protein NVI2019_GHJFPKLH_01116 [Providencia alcalifaciens]